MSQRSTSHVSQINESCHTEVTSHPRRGWHSGLHRRTQNAEHMSHVSQSHELCDTDRRVMSHRSTSHVTQESRHTVAEGGFQGYIVEHKMLST